MQNSSNLIQISNKSHEVFSPPGSSRDFKQILGTAWLSPKIPQQSKVSLNIIWPCLFNISCNLQFMLSHLRQCAIIGCSGHQSSWLIQRKTQDPVPRTIYTKTDQSIKCMRQIKSFLHKEACSWPNSSKCASWDRQWPKYAHNVRAKKWFDSCLPFSVHSHTCVLNQRFLPVPYNSLYHQRSPQPMSRLLLGQVDPYTCKRIQEFVHEPNIYLSVIAPTRYNEVNAEIRALHKV